MDKTKSLFNSAKSKYDSGSSPLNELLALFSYCIDKIAASGLRRIELSHTSKRYFSFTTEQTYTRPILDSLYIPNAETFSALWLKLIESADKKTFKFNSSEELINSVLYTSIMSFSACFDLWQPKSRKTPGTAFEVLLGSLLECILDGYTRTKHIPLVEIDESVATDIVFSDINSVGGLVFPAKITTRERIVQPFAHQKILDSVYGEGAYRSILMCVSETQRDKDTQANDICVPGPIKLYQKHLARLTGIYYLDIPARYTSDDVTGVIPIASIGSVFSSGFSPHLK